MAKDKKKIDHPWVSAATLCEKLLEEKDNVFSAIRMVDMVTIPTPPDWDRKTPLQFLVNAILAFKSGDVKGKRTLRVYGTSPKGERNKLVQLAIEFLGGGKGTNIKANILLGVRHEGTHWLDVYVNKWLATRIPLTIAFAVTPTPPTDATRPSG